MDRNELIKSVLKTYQDGVKIIVAKNQDYAQDNDAFSNFRSANVVGVSAERAILVRVMDKLARISNLIGKDTAVKDETIEDSILDCINYLAIFKAMIEKKTIKKN